MDNNKIDYDNMSFGKLLNLAYQEVLDDVTRKKILSKYVKNKIPPLKRFSNEEIKALRKEFNCTQQMFASILGVTKQSVEAWENGKHSPSGSVHRIMSLMKSKGYDFIANDLPLLGE